MSKFNFKSFISGMLASGKHYAPDILTGGGIILGWVGVYFFWKQSKKAEKRIAEEEAKLNADENGEPLDIPEEEKQSLSKKDKLCIYLQYCYVSLLMGLASTGLNIWANRIQASRLVEMAMLTKFMSEKDDEKKEYVKELEKETGKKKVQAIKSDIRCAQFSDADIVQRLKEKMAEGDMTPLVLDRCTGNAFSATVMDIAKAFRELNETLRTELENELRGKLTDPFVVLDNPPWDDAFDDVYTSLSLDTFLYRLGETNKQAGCRLGELLEFRYYRSNGGSDLLDYSDPDVFGYETRYKELYFSEDEQVPDVIYIDYTDFLKPSFEAVERYTM